MATTDVLTGAAFGHTWKHDLLVIDLFEIGIQSIQVKNS